MLLIKARYVGLDGAWEYYKFYSIFVDNNIVYDVNNKNKRIYNTVEKFLEIWKDFKGVADVD